MNKLLSMAISMLLAGIIMLVITVVIWLKIISFRDCPVVTAEVIDHKTSTHFSNGRSRNTYSIKLSYNVNGVDYERSIACDSEEYKLGVNRPVDIRYKSMNPKRIMIDNEGKNQRGQKVLWIITGALLALSALMFAIGA